MQSSDETKAITVSANEMTRTRNSCSKDRTLPAGTRISEMEVKKMCSVLAVVSGVVLTCTSVDLIQTVY